MMMEHEHEHRVSKRDEFASNETSCAVPMIYVSADERRDIKLKSKQANNIKIQCSMMKRSDDDERNQNPILKRLNI